jgi:hypothetical protein
MLTYNTCLKSECVQAILAESRVVDVLMSCAMSVAERCRVDNPQGLAVEPGREEPTLKVSSDSSLSIVLSLFEPEPEPDPYPVCHLKGLSHEIDLKNFD